MRLHIWTLISCLVLAAPAQAFSCLFDTECYETEDCKETEFLAQVSVEDKQLVTNFGTKTIVAIKQGESLITLFATGHDTEYMMSVTPEAARMSAQVNQGPLVFSYLGHCEGAF